MEIPTNYAFPWCSMSKPAECVRCMDAGLSGACAATALAHLQAGHTTCPEWVMGGICLAFGRKKQIPATFHCSLGQLINGVAITVSPEGQEHVLPCWPLVISTQVKRDYAETNGRGGGRKPEVEINEDAIPRFPKKSL